MKTINLRKNYFYHIDLLVCFFSKLPETSTVIKNIMVKVRIHCPQCNKKGYIEVRDNLMEDCKRGVTAVNIESQAICNHSFIAYIDTQFTMRDAFSTDFTVELPEINFCEDSNANQEIDTKN